MAERRSGTPANPTPTGGPPKAPFSPSTPGNAGRGNVNAPGTYMQNELGRVLPEPFPPPYPPLAEPSLDRLTREYVAGGGWAWYGQVARTLPNAIDDVTADFGDDLYERMLFDPQVSAVSTIFKASILESGLDMTSAIKSRSNPNFDLAAEIADEAARMVSEFDGTFDDVLWNLLDCLAFGNKVAEQTYKLGPARKDGRKILMLDKLKVRPRRATVYAVDIYMNVVGLLVRVPPNASPWSATMMFGPEDEPFNLIPPQKFVITNFRPKDNDPRGSSLLRPAYSPWWRKQQIVPEYLKYLSQFAGPSLVGYVGPDATPQVQPDGTVITGEQVMLTALQALRNGTAAAFPNGAKVDPLVMQGDGAAFLRAIDNCDQQITKAVLTQELATEQSRNQARAAAQVHQDVLDTLIRQGKLAFAAQIRNQLFKRWVAYNWGDDAAELAPKLNFGKTILREQPALWGAVSQMMGQGYLAPSQLALLDEMVGLPVRDEVELYPALPDPGDQQTDQPATPDDDGDGEDGASAPAQPAQDPSITEHPGAGYKPVPPPHQVKAIDATSQLPGMVRVQGHVRRMPNSRGDVPGVTGTTPQAGGKKKPARARSQLYAVNEPSGATGSPGLPVPSAGAYG
jgi:hypothetical protein